MASLINPVERQFSLFRPLSLSPCFINLVSFFLSRFSSSVLSNNFSITIVVQKLHGKMPPFFPFISSFTLPFDRRESEFLKFIEI